MPELTGGCLCGAVRYKVVAEPMCVSHCHCPSCRRAAGAPFITWMTLPGDGYAVTRGEAAVYHSSPGVNRRFCGTCGTTLSYDHDDRTDEIDVAAATLDDPEAVTPDDHIHVGHRLGWLKFDDGLPGLEGDHWDHGYPDRSGGDGE